jgi:lysyl-tRNA synthetase class I
MTETFCVSCPGCGKEKKHMASRAETIGVHCSCGVSASVDIEAQEIGDWWKRE